MSIQETRKFGRCGSRAVQLTRDRDLIDLPIPEVEI